MMAASAQRLIAAGLPMEEFVQSMPNLTAASQNLYELIQSGGLVVYPDPGMGLSVSRAIASEGSRGWKIDKAKQAHKIDVVIALGMAAYAAVQSQGEAPPLLPYDQWAGDGGADDWFRFQRSFVFCPRDGRHVLGLRNERTDAFGAAQGHHSRHSRHHCVAPGRVYIDAAD
jgi:hypothetical protein